MSFFLDVEALSFDNEVLEENKQHLTVVPYDEIWKEAGDPGCFDGGNGLNPSSGWD